MPKATAPGTRLCTSDKSLSVGSSSCSSPTAWIDCVTSIMAPSRRVAVTMTSSKYASSSSCASATIGIGSANASISNESVACFIYLPFLIEPLFETKELRAFVNAPYFPNRHSMAWYEQLQQRFRANSPIFLMTKVWPSILGAHRLLA